MKILAIHADFIEFQAKKKAFAKAEENINEERQHINECLVVFTAAEKADEADPVKIKEMYLFEIEKIMQDVKAERVVLYPYAHLSSDLSKPNFAENFMKEAENELRAKGIKVFRAPFGWYKSFNISCKGHPLSELSRHLVTPSGDSVSLEESSSSEKEKGEYVGIVKEEKKFELGEELDDKQRQAYSMALVAGAAVKMLYREAELASIDFHLRDTYIDISGAGLKQEDLKKIRKKMKWILNKGIAFEKIESLNTASKYVKEIAEDLGEAQAYKFMDLISVPLYKNAFVSNTSELGVFKLVNISSAYWKGSAANEQLSRVSLVAFKTEGELEVYNKEREDAEARSHIKLGKELGLFVISDLVGPGLPLLTPKGMTLRREIVDYLWSLHQQHDYKWVWTPHIAKEALYKTSGHWDKFGDELFKVQGKTDKFVMKPMNCPHHMQIFDSFSLSYRDMPVRFFEPATIYRDEKSGQLHGLTRVRSITQDDGHIFCRRSQIAQEVGIMVDAIRKFYKTFGMDTEYWVSLSVRGDDHSKYLGGDEVWELAETALEAAAQKNNLPYKKIKGEAAFYGPKLDFMFKDSLGREWQLATIQADFNLPERFNLSFMNEQSQKERPVVIHRAISGSLERFMGIVIEHYAGKFPLWLSPVQVKLITVNDNANDFAYDVAKKLRSKSIRVSVDDRSETIGKKVRDAQLEKTNYMVTIGDKELEKKTLAVRSREGKVDFGVTVEKFVRSLLDERDSRK